MTKNYMHKITGDCVSSVTIDKRGLDLSEYVELVRCSDGVLRAIDTVDATDRFVWPNATTTDFDTD